MRTVKSSDERRTEIIAKARDLFHRQGVEHTTISQIAQEIGIAKGLFYYYFSTKSDVVSAVVEQTRREVEVQAKAVIANPERSFIQKMVEFTTLYLERINTLSSSIDQEKGKAQIPELVQNRFEQLSTDMDTQQMDRLVEIGVAEGILKIQYPEAMFTMVVRGIGAIARQRIIPRSEALTLIEQALGLHCGSLAVQSTVQLADSGHSQ
ncbi:MAG: TetR/AcrR family transcriptional regulator [Sphaerochaetaceae bacterium]